MATKTPIPTPTQTTEKTPITEPSSSNFYTPVSDEISSSPEKLGAALKKWQRILRLQDWHVTVQVRRRNDFHHDGSCLGEIITHLSTKAAFIHILSPEDYDPDFAFPVDQTKTLIHELIHLHMLWHGLEPGTHAHDLMEQSVEILAQAFVTLDRMALPQPTLKLPTSASEIILSPEKLQAALKIWQYILRLQDWEILTSIDRGHTFDVPSGNYAPVGRMTTNTYCKYAKLKFLDPVDYLNYFKPQNMLHTLLHELVHVLLIWDEQEEDTWGYTFMEQAVECLSGSLYSISADKVNYISDNITNSLDTLDTLNTLNALNTADIVQE